MLMGTSEKGQRQDGLGALLQRSCQGGARSDQCAQVIDFVGFMRVGADVRWRMGLRAIATVSTQCQHSGGAFIRGLGLVFGLREGNSGFRLWGDHWAFQSNVCTAARAKCRRLPRRAKMQWGIF
jgi:hypothetical protein